MNLRVPWVQFLREASTDDEPFRPLPLDVPVAGAFESVAYVGETVASVLDDVEALPGAEVFVATVPDVPLTTSASHTFMASNRVCSRTAR